MFAALKRACAARIRFELILLFRIDSLVFLLNFTCCVMIILLCSEIATYGTDAPKLTTYIRWSLSNKALYIGIVVLGITQLAYSTLSL